MDNFRKGQVIMLVLIMALTLIAFVGGVVVGSLWERPNTGLILGKVYTDTNSNGALDSGDAIVRGEASGFVIILYTEKQRPDKIIEMVQVAVAVVEDGEYRFEVPPGKYYVGTMYGDTQIHKTRYSRVEHIGGGTLEIEKGKVVLGPTILFSNTGGGKG